MARTSFTLRKTTSDFGSYVAYPTSSDGSASAQGLTVRPDDDTYLRVDDLQVAAPLLPVFAGSSTTDGTGYFNVEAVDYNTTEVTWGVQLATTVTATPQPVQVVVTYSSQGEPATVSEGSVLAESVMGEDRITHVVIPGDWAYYTLFIKYQSTTTTYYEPAASLSVLVPTDYATSTDLYNKIPSYYRTQDAKLDEGNGGPLYRYLSVVGWDVDRFKSLVNYLIACKDPQVANGQVLDLLASDLGLDLMSHELGAARLRALLEDIGRLRRSNGVPTTVTSSISALTGSVVAMFGKDIRIYPQRVNFITDPMLTSTGANADGGTPSSTFAESIDGGSAGTTSFDASGPYGSPVDGGAPNTVFTESGAWSAVINPVEVNEYIARSVNPEVPLFPGEILYFSVHNNSQDMVTKVGLDAITGSTRTPVVETTTPLLLGGRKYWKMVIPDDFTVSLPTITSATVSGLDGTITFDAPHNLNTSLNQGGMFVTLSGFTPSAWNGSFYVTDIPTSTTLRITFNAPAPASATVVGTVTTNRALTAVRFHYSPTGDPGLSNAIGGKLLLEKYFVGNYFDGDTVRGGWITGSPSISDYRWLGSPNSSFSVYSENYQKTVSVVRRLLPSIMPVTQLISSGTIYSNRSSEIGGLTLAYNLIYNYIPGHS